VSDTAPASPGGHDPRADRQAWKQLPVERRRQLERGRATPSSHREARVVMGRALHLTSWRGSLEWVGAGAAGSLLAIVLMGWFLGQPPDLGFALVFIAGWSVGGLMIRTLRARTLRDAANQAFAAPDGGAADDGRWLPGDEPPGRRG
jgi:hypothetical protein